MERPSALSTRHTGPDTRWLVHPEAKPVWREWGEAHYAFDSRSHQTHFLNTLAAEIFHLLGERPMTHTELCDELVAGCALDDADDLREAVASTLYVLDSLGLLARASAP
jgi:PqqD family protein of HPr-rel-A system